MERVQVKTVMLEVVGLVVILLRIVTSMLMVDKVEVLTLEMGKKHDKTSALLTQSIFLVEMVVTGEEQPEMDMLMEAMVKIK